MLNEIDNIKQKECTRWISVSYSNILVQIGNEVSKPIVSDMDDEMLSEAVDTAVTACDKYPDNLEAAAQMLKVSQRATIPAVFWHQLAKICKRIQQQRLTPQSRPMKKY